MKTELVIARYNEDVSWTTVIDNPDIVCTIYNKGQPINLPYVQLPNIGRESHTYLHHIIENYNNLADVTVFCQGDSVFHSPKFMELIHSADQFEPVQRDEGEKRDRSGPNFGESGSLSRPQLRFRRN